MIMKNRFLFIPFLILILSVGFDRLLTLEVLQGYYSKTLSDLNFIQKDELYEDYKNYLQKSDRRKVLVYFGNSRALLFDKNYTDEKYKNWILYNFSVPGGTPDYFTYWLERFESDKAWPDFIILDQSMEVYNAGKLLTLDDVLVYGVSVPFFIKHFFHYSRTEIATFLSKRLFLTYLYRPKLDTIKNRFKNQSKEYHDFMNLRILLKSRLSEGRGSAMTPGTYESVLSDELLKKSAYGDYFTYFSPYRFDSKILDWQTRNIDILKNNNIPFAFIWVRVSRPYFENSKTIPVTTRNNDKVIPYEDWKPKLDEFHKLHSANFWNMNEDPNYNCDLFSDSGHMSPACYPAYSDYIFNHLP